MSETIVIAERFRGPPNSGNGGYVCGAFADLLTRGEHNLGDGRVAEVTLRAPIPLDVPLDVQRGDDTLRVVRGDTLIAEAAFATLELEVPAPPTYAAALAERAHSPSFVKGMTPMFAGAIGFHPVCFCCGTQHPEGLQVYAAAMPGAADGLVAAAWSPRAEWGDANGHLPEAFVWGALDCPGQFAFLATGIRTGLLGRMSARILRPVRAGVDCVVIGWCAGNEGRKYFAGTALFDGDGLAACAYETWIGRRD